MPRTPEFKTKEQRLAERKQKQQQARKKKTVPLNTVEPVAVLPKSEFDRMLNMLHTLRTMEEQTPDVRVSLKKNAKTLITDMEVYYKQMVQYYRLAE